MAEYDPTWPDSYRAERDAVLDHVGDEIERIDHIGSTAIPGMTAKPIVDIMCVMDDLDPVPELVAPLHDRGYEYGHQLDYWHVLFRRDGDEQFNLHFLRSGDDMWYDNLLFREYLRENPTEADKYERLKRELAEQHPDDLQAYSRGKTEFVTTIVEIAKHDADGTAAVPDSI
ncbi:MAG: GrpB family protein [Halalkalicoccus sp.]